MSKSYFVGLDLGQTNDPSALVILERTGVESVWYYAARHLHRWPLGTRCPLIVTETRQLLTALPSAVPHVLVVDNTGVGRAVVDLFREGSPICIVPLTITSGHDATIGPDGPHVPKKQLVSVLQALLQTGRLKVAASLPLARTLTQELEVFRAKITTAANETFEAWREKDKDDIVLALCIAAWLGESQPVPYTGPICYNSFAPWEADKKDEPTVKPAFELVPGGEILRVGDVEVHLPDEREEWWR
jgi:hypothetical protein